MKAVKRIFGRSTRLASSPASQKSSPQQSPDSPLNTSPHPPSDSSSHKPAPDSQAASSSPSSPSPCQSIHEKTLQNETRPLAKLPPELLTQITTFLPTPSSGLLALTCKTISKKLGTTPLTKLSMGKPGPGFPFNFHSKLHYIQRQRQDFLLLLEKDFPSLIYCHFCRLLHDTLKTNSYNLKCTSDIARHDCKTLRKLDSNYSHRYLLMKHHRLGHNISQELARFQKSDTLQLPESTVHRTHTTKILHHQFRTRTKHTITLPRGGESEALILAIRCQSWDICNHLPWSGYAALLPQLVYCRLTHPKSPCEKCRGMKTCNVCFTEFEILTAICGEGRFGLVVTSWRDLGTVETPHDEKFKCLEKKGRGVDGISPVFGCLRKEFEEGI